jgi:hypothetical protein
MITKLRVKHCRNDGELYKGFYKSSSFELSNRLLSDDVLLHAIIVCDFFLQSFVQCSCDA